MSETFEPAAAALMSSPPNAPSMRVVRNTVTLRQQVLEVLRDAILNFQFKPGDRLIERELCEMTGVSRTSVREALRHLESEGLVQNLPNRGPIVATLTLDEAREIYEVRRALEGLAARLFAERAGAEQHAALDAVMVALERAFATDDTRTIVKATAQFYDVVLGACGNELVRRLISSLHARVTYLRATSVSQPGRAPDSLAEMRRLVAALKSGNPDQAQAVCLEHIDRAATVGLAVLQRRQSAAD
jgi:GntR family transcriptional regulator, trigonelline degradation regulator